MYIHSEDGQYIYCPMDKTLKVDNFRDGGFYVEGVPLTLINNSAGSGGEPFGSREIALSFLESLVSAYELGRRVFRPDWKKLRSLDAKQAKKGK